MKTLVAVLLGLAVQQRLAETLNCSSVYQRYPVDSDITVNCGPTTITLSINACPVQYAMFDPLTLALNGKHSMNNCIGILQTTFDPPVVQFVFPFNDTTQNACGNVISIVSNIGTGIFQSFSNIQTVIISGYVDTPQTLDTSLISYSTNLNYNFSCYYPLQYMLNNTQILTSSANVAVNTNNGSFISTLSMQLFTDQNLTVPLQSNGSALQLKKKVYVAVIATNLTANFNVLLDECFATPLPLMTTTASDKFVLLAGCTTANRTTVLLNGFGKSAEFMFDTFRFLQYSSQQISTIYLHCSTRLCQPDTCTTLLQACNTPSSTSGRRRRDVALAENDGATERVTVSSGPIYTTDTEATDLSSSQSNSVAEAKQLQGTLMGLVVGLIIAAMLGAALVFASVILYKMYRLRDSQAKKTLDN
ncbi:zona pellucida-like domain-containing protein 1 [Pseudophryne corroboree]|uniref:zona pellucida-like domain-containing protein 1 n=1 Tax=Pseudophryne corroboree TaxID=495146 RepID=UPI00308217A4